MRPDLTAQEVRDLLARCVRGVGLLVWDGELYRRVTPEALREALRAVPNQKDKP